MFSNADDEGLLDAVAPEADDGHGEADAGDGRLHQLVLEERLHLAADLLAVDLLVLLLGTVVLGLGGLGLLSADTAGASATERRGECEVDVLLGVETDNERGDVDNMLADTVES